MRIRFDKIDGFIKIYYGTGTKSCDGIYDWIKCTISEKGGITYNISHNFAIIKVDSFHSLPVEKAMTFLHDVIILTVFNKEKNNYYNIFLEKASYKLPKQKVYA